SGRTRVPFPAPRAASVTPTSHRTSDRSPSERRAPRRAAAGFPPQPGHAPGRQRPAWQALHPCRRNQQEEGTTPMHILTGPKTGLAIALLATVVTYLLLVDGAHAAVGGNAANAKLCQKGGWSKLMDSSAQQFAGED